MTASVVPGTPLDANKQHEIAAAAKEQGSRPALYKPFGPEWSHPYFGKWQTICYALYELLPAGASVLDVGCGQGWTTVFLAESGFRPTGIDIAPANVADSSARAQRYGSDAEFTAADMDSFDLGRTFDAALVFDALHHSTRPRQVIAQIARHLVPGGWVLFGEPSWLHTISPHARRTHREVGWVERGVAVRHVKRDCRLAGLGNFRRYYEGTAPHRGGAKDLAYQTARLYGARVSTAPQMSVWLAAQKQP
jgi:SAM-dependent methyltransferase